MTDRPSRLQLNFVICLAFLTLFIGVAPKTAAQDLDEVTLSGRVTDQNGAVVPGAQVTATLTAENQQRTATTDGEGRYRLVELKPGAYTIRVVASGFAEVEQPNLDFLSGDNRQLNYKLSVGTVNAQTVVINDDTTPAVDITRTIVGGTVTQREIEELPNINRNPLDLVFTLPGVTEEPLSARDVAEDRVFGTLNQTRAPLEAGIFLTDICISHIRHL